MGLWIGRPRGELNLKALSSGSIKNRPDGAISRRIGTECLMAFSASSL
jgi:hypothetical protein